METEFLTLYNVCSVHRGTLWVHRGDIMSKSVDVQYIREISWWMWGDTMNTLGDVQYIRGIPWVHRGEIMSTSGDVQYMWGDIMIHVGGYHDTCGGDIMIHVGEQLDKILSISIENPDVLNIPWCTHDIPLMYSWYPPDVLMVSTWCTEHPRCTHDIPLMYSWYPPRCTNGIHLMYWTSPMYSWYPPPHMYHDIPLMYWASLDVFMISPPMYSWYPSDVLMVSLRCTEHLLMYSWYPSDVLMVSLRCTHGIPPMYSWYPPDVLNIPRCTEHTLYTVLLSVAARYSSKSIKKAYMLWKGIYMSFQIQSIKTLLSFWYNRTILHLLAVA